LDENFRRIFQEVGFLVLELHKPLGREGDPVEWLDETRARTSEAMFWKPTERFSAIEK
jgi:hypothetical protein